MDQKYGKDPSNRYGTGLWNGCCPGPAAGPYNLTCTLFAVQELAHTQLLLVNCWESALGTGATEWVENGESWEIAMRGFVTNRITKLPKQIMWDTD